MTDEIYQFENYLLDVRKQRLFRDGRAVKTDLRTIDLLTCLVQASPDWVDKNDLLDRLWPDQEITDWALSRLVSDTRKLLGDDGEKQHIIKTIRGRGFQICDDVKRISSTQGHIPDLDAAAPSIFWKRPKQRQYMLGALLLSVLFFGGFFYLQHRVSAKQDSTALVNLTSSEKSPLNDILEDWALSQDDMILVKDKSYASNIGGDKLFQYICGGGKCSQLILITVRDSGREMAYHYQVLSDGFREENRELISSSELFLISALRDAVANTMNRSSDYFPVTLSIFMQNPDQLFQDMYRIHINLENTYVTFVAQARRRNELVASITRRLNVKREQQYEKFFITYFNQMNQEERFVFDQMRAMTSGTLYQGNRNILTLLEGNPDLMEEIPALEDVRKHLAFWINKYHQIFLTREDMCLLYVGVEDGVPFPSGIDKQVSHWLDKHRATSSKVDMRKLN